MKVPSGVNGAVSDVGPMIFDFEEVVAKVVAACWVREVRPSADDLKPVCTHLVATVESLGGVTSMNYRLNLKHR